MVEIGVIGGDGIGPEVVRAGMKVLEAAASDDPSLELSFTEFPWGCEYYLEHGRMMPEDGLETLADYGDLDITVVRENTEGEYSDSFFFFKQKTAYEIAVQESIFTRRGVERI